MYDPKLLAEDITITKPGIISLLLNVNKKKTPGSDKIPKAFLKRYAEHTAQYPLILFNQFLEFGVVQGERTYASHNHTSRVANPVLQTTAPLH